MTFAAAMDELTALVDELESDALDVDDLTTPRRAGRGPGPVVPRPHRRRAVLGRGGAGAPRGGRARGQ